APTPFLEPGPFNAKLSGYIKNSLKGAYSFRVVGSGTIVVKINEKAILKLPDDKDKEVEIELAKNYNKLEIDYTSPPKGDATLRPEATMPGVLAGPDAAKHAADIAAYLVSLKKYAEPKPLGNSPKSSDGAVLFNKLGCNSCHRLDEPGANDELGRLSLHHVGAK